MQHHVFIMDMGFLDQFSQSDYLNWGVTIISIFLTVFFYFKSRRKRVPFYSCRSTRLIQRDVNQINCLEVFYDKRKLTALTITKLAFWNNGRDTISKTDIAEKDRVRVQIKEAYEILSCEVIAQTKEANNVVVSMADDRKSVSISFDYLDYKEGVVLKIRHTGSESEDLEIKGSIKAVKSIQRKGRMWPFASKSSRPLQWRKVRVLRIILGCISLFISLYGIYILFLSSEKVQLLLHSQIVNATIDKYILSVFYILFGAAYSYLSLEPFVRSVPKALHDVYMGDDF